MNTYYLDTCYLQKWFNRTLNDGELDFLDNLIKNKENILVLSRTHFIEWMDRDDKPATLKLAEFLDKISNKIWIKGSDILKINEFEYAYRFFKFKKATEISAFENDLAHVLPVSSDTLEFRVKILPKIAKESTIEMLLKLYWYNKDKQMHFNRVLFDKKSLELSKLQHEKSVKMKKTIWFEEILKVLKKILRQYIENCKIEDSNIEIFIDYLITRKDLILSTIIPLYVQHYIHRTGKKIKFNDVSDLDHLTVVRYCDYIVLDNPMANSVKDLVKWVNSHIPELMDISKKVHGSISEFKKAFNVF